MKHLFLAAILLSPISAMAEKIVYTLRGEQFVENIGQGGGVTSDAEIVWRESEHGPLPVDAPIGYAERHLVEVEKTVSQCVLNEQGEPVIDQESESGQCIKEDVTQKVMEPRLRENATLKSAKETRDSAKATKEASDAAEKSVIRAIKAKLDADTSPTAAEQRKILKALVEKVLGK